MRSVKVRGVISVKLSADLYRLEQILQTLPLPSDAFNQMFAEPFNCICSA